MPDKLQILNAMLACQVLPEGLSPSGNARFRYYKASNTRALCADYYDPFICIMTQGEKVCWAGDAEYRYTKGDYFINFVRSPVKSQITSASAEKPMLAAVVEIDLLRLADMVVRIERECPQLKDRDKPQSASGMITGVADDNLLDAVIRLTKVSANPAEATILGDAIIDEIYFRILTGENGAALRYLLSQNGQVQQVSRVVQHIHDNLDRPIAIGELVGLANMSKTAFFDTFRKVMHVAPQQYIKSVKLQQAQRLLKEGAKANQASYQVGYNSFSQFSREYKRYFGFAPSQTQ